MTLTEGIITAIIAALAAVAVAIVNRRRSRIEHERAAAEIRESSFRSEIGAVAALKDLREELDILRGQLRTSRDSEDDCRDKLAEAHMNVAALVERMTQLESAMPALIVSEKLRVLDTATRGVLNRIRHGGIVITLPSEGGRLIFVTEVFAGWLGMTPSQVLAKGWRALMHPDDVARAGRAESRAAFEGGEGVFRYRHADGHYVALRWFYTPYGDGAFCVVWNEELN